MLQKNLGKKLVFFNQLTVRTRLTKNFSFNLSSLIKSSQIVIKTFYFETIAPKGVAISYSFIFYYFKLFSIDLSHRD